MQANGHTDAPGAASHMPATAAPEHEGRHPEQPEAAKAQLFLHGIATLLFLASGVMGFSGRSGLLPAIGASICVLLAHLSAPAPARKNAPDGSKARPTLGILSRLAFGAMFVFVILGVLMLMHGHAPWTALIGAAVSLLIGAFAIPDPARVQPPDTRA